MKKIVATFSLFAVMAVFAAGCSSAAKKGAENPALDAVSNTQAAPANLGAASSGRGL
jgi:hypothetical protein